MKIKCISTLPENDVIEQLSRGALLADRAISKGTLMSMAFDFGGHTKILEDGTYIVCTEHSLERAIENLRKFQDRAVGFLSALGRPAFHVDFEIVE